MIDGLDGAMASEVRPILSDDGRPFFRCVHDAPPLVDFQIPLWVPRAEMVAKRVSRMVGWKTTAWHRYGPEPGNVCRPQLTPPSRDTNIPSLPPAVCVTPPRQMW